VWVLRLGMHDLLKLRHEYLRWGPKPKADGCKWRGNIHYAGG